MRKRNRLRTIWYNMIQRCKNDGNEAHKNWGGRGIVVCEEWHDFNNFQKWALANGYADGLTIDRENVEGNYEPSNCRWITYKDQARNTRKNHYVTINGESHIIPDWCKILGNVTPATVYRRMRKYGWSAEKALLTPNIGIKNVDASVKQKWNDSKCIPLMAYNDSEVIHFSCIIEVEQKGFNRKSAALASQGKWKNENPHMYKGYIWCREYEMEV